VVVAPYMDYPQLLGVLLRLLGEGGDGGGKRGVLRLLGVLGALDPHMHKVNQANLKVRVALGCSRTSLSTAGRALVAAGRAGGCWTRTCTRSTGQPEGARLCETTAGI
jgi:serine/threonine-protein kinase mTOR